MDFTNNINEIQQKLEELTEELQYFNNRIDTKKVTNEDKLYVLEEIKHFRKSINKLSAKIQNIAIFHKKKYNVL